MRLKFHKGTDISGRDSYAIPHCAVMGASDTGLDIYGLAPSEASLKELRDFKEYLKAREIPSRIKETETNNIFEVKKWVVLSNADNYGTGVALANQYISLKKKSLKFIHLAKE